MSELAVRDLTIQYRAGNGSVRPFEGLTLDVDRGTLVVLVGASGSGKTSLLSALAGILTPHAGRIRVGDTDVTSLRGLALDRYRRHGVGVVFQAFNLVRSLTALENVQVPLLAAGVRRSMARARAGAVLDEVGFEDGHDRRPGQLSGGQQQRVAIARAIANDPTLLLADEPTAHLDAHHVDPVLNVLRRLADHGRVVVVATHDARLLRVADRVVELGSVAAYHGAGQAWSGLSWSARSPRGEPERTGGGPMRVHSNGRRNQERGPGHGARSIPRPLTKAWSRRGRGDLSSQIC